MCVCNMCVFSSMHVCARVYVCMHCVWRLDMEFKYLSLVFVTLFLKTRFSLNIQFNDPDRLAGHQAPGIFLDPLPSPAITNTLRTQLSCVLGMTLDSHICPSGHLPSSMRASLQANGMQTRRSFRMGSVTRESLAQLKTETSTIHIPPL